MGERSSWPSPPDHSSETPPDPIHIDPTSLRPQLHQLQWLIQMHSAVKESNDYETEAELRNIIAYCLAQLCLASIPSLQEEYLANSDKSKTLTKENKPNPNPNNGDD